VNAVEGINTLELITLY